MHYDDSKSNQFNTSARISIAMVFMQKIRDHIAIAVSKKKRTQ